MNRPIRYFADLNPGTGYNIAARGVVHMLRALGYTQQTLRLIPAILTDFRAADSTDDDDWTRDWMHGPWMGDDGHDQINIVHLNPGAVGDYHTAAGGRYNIAVTAWETDRLPKTVFNTQRTVVGDLNKFDEVWVPTRWNAEMFKACGVEKPILVLPHALLPEVLDRHVDRTNPAAETRFYGMGTWNARKDPEMLLRAWFSTSFNPMTPARLSLYSVPPTRMLARVHAHGYLADQCARELAKRTGHPDSVPQYGLFTTYKPYDIVLQRHAACDVFVSASHGEGFCLPALEAAAMGNWIIGGGPWLEELAEVAGRLEDGGLVDLLPTTVVPITPVPEVAGYELDQRWWTVQLDTLVAALEAAHAARQEAGPADGREAAEHVRAYYRPQNLAKLIAPRLEAIGRVLAETGW